MKTRRSLFSFAVALLSAGAIVGCGSSSSSTTSSSAAATSSASTSASSSAAAPASADAAVAALVPSAIKSKGTLAVAADASYAPNEFIGSDGHTVVGMDADLMQAIAATMGLKATIANVTFDAIIPGLAAGKYDVGASSFTDTKAREKVVDFVDYFSAGESFYTKASGGVSISGLADLCGKTVAVENTTTEQTDAQTQGKKCKAAGKPAVSVMSFPNQNAANLALSSGRAQLGFADSPVAAYAVKKSNGQFKLVGTTFATAPYGLAIPKKSGLGKPILAAMTALVKNGAYTKILTKWGVQAGAIAAPKANGATS